ncbi:MAG: nucleoside recognition domain-containing protein [Pseudomonadota bacterium]|nr:nucleoside recognition domain-containing protein [Pseudomonadota bacterium]
MNAVFFAIVFISFTVAAYREVFITQTASDLSHPMKALATGMVDAAADSVTLAIGLVGVMSMFLGLMKVAEAGGLLTIIARLLKPLMVRLFPEVPAEHPAMGAMIMNLSANIMGLGNAATPFGIRAMQELDKLNEHKGTATNAMVLFLAVNTSSVTLLPTGVIALRASLGSSEPAAILPTTLFATLISTVVAILSAKFYQRYFSMGPSVAALGKMPDQLRTIAEPPEAITASGASDSGDAYPGWISLLAFAVILALIPLTIFCGSAIAPWIIPGLMVGLLGFGMWRRIRVYEVFVEGAKDGFQVAIRIIPYLVAILVAVGMFRASGAMELLIEPLGALTQIFGLPPEALPMALLRPLSGSGAYGILASILTNPETGPDTYVGLLVSTFQGSTETTFYVLAVYFGAVGIRRIRHALAAGITGDIAGIVAAVSICLILFD